MINGTTEGRFHDDTRYAPILACAEPLPVLGICAAIGLEGKKPEEIRRLALYLTATNADPESQRQAFIDLGAFILGELHARRTERTSGKATIVASHPPLMCSRI